MIKLGCADFTWPLLPHEAVVAHIRALGFEGVDLGLFGNRSHVRPEVIRKDVPMWSGRILERLEASELAVADVFLVPWTDPKRMAANHPDRAERSAGHDLFLDVLEFARRVGAPGMTMNSGTVFPDEAWSESIARSTEELKRRVDAAGLHGIQIRIEGGVGSNTDNPAKLLELVSKVAGLKLTVDYTHFVYQDIAEADAEPLLDHAGHIQCRGAAPGRIQTPFGENTIDYGRMIDRLMAIGYEGYFSMEYVWMDLWDCKRTENTMETIQFKEFVESRIEGREFVPFESPV